MKKIYNKMMISRIVAMCLLILAITFVIIDSLFSDKTTIFEVAVVCISLVGSLLAAVLEKHFEKQYSKAEKYTKISLDEFLKKNLKENNEEINHENKN